MIKRYDPSWHKPMEMDEETSGDWIEYADHAAFVAQVREIAEGVGHGHRCPSREYISREGKWVFRNMTDNSLCTCPRGKLLALCEVE